MSFFAKDVHLLASIFSIKLFFFLHFSLFVQQLYTFLLLSNLFILWCSVRVR